MPEENEDVVNSFLKDNSGFKAHEHSAHTR